MKEEISRSIAEQAISELRREPPIVLMSPAHWERLTAAIAAGIADHLTYFWQDKNVRNALAGQHERQQTAYWERHGTDADRMAAQKHRAQQYRRYGVEPW